MKNNRLTVLHTESSLGWGGQEIRIVEESRRIIQRGYRVIIAAPERSIISKKAARAGISVFHMEFKKKNPMNFMKVRALIEREKVDIVNTHSSADSWVTTIAAKLSARKPKIIRTRHLSTPISKSVLSRLIYNVFPDAVMTTGMAIKERMVHYNNFNSGKIFSLPTGVDLHSFDPSRISPCISKEGFLIGVIGVLRSWKGHDFLLDAVPSLSRTIKDSFFYIVGDGPQANNLKRKVSEMDIQNRVFFLGHREDIPEIIASLDVVVHPSYENEGIPQSILQAMAMKKPVIASNVGAIDEVVLNNNTGFLLEPKKPILIARKIEELYRAPHLRVKLGAEARTFVEKNFSVDSMVDNVERLYTKLSLQNHS